MIRVWHYDIENRDGENTLWAVKKRKKEDVMGWVVKCDGCGIVLDPETGKFEAAARQAAARAGWLIDPLGILALHGGIDFCPNCRTQRKTSLDTCPEVMTERQP